MSDSIAQIKKRELVISMALHVTLARQFWNENPEGPNADADIEYNERALDDAVRAYARLMGMVDPQQSPERDAPTSLTS